MIHTWFNFADIFSIISFYIHMVHLSSIGCGIFKLIHAPYTYTHTAKVQHYPLCQHLQTPNKGCCNFTAQVCPLQRSSAEVEPFLSTSKEGYGATNSRDKIFIFGGLSFICTPLSTHMSGREE